MLGRYKYLIPLSQVADGDLEIRLRMLDVREVLCWVTSKRRPHTLRNEGRESQKRPCSAPCICVFRDRAARSPSPRTSCTSVPNCRCQAITGNCKSRVL